MIDEGNRDRKLQCPECEFKTWSKTILRRHVDPTTLQTPSLRFQYSCGHCDIKTTNDVVLNSHIEEKHRRKILNSENPFSCEHCDKHYKKEWALRQHRTFMHGETEAEEDIKTRQNFTASSGEVI